MRYLTVYRCAAWNEMFPAVYKLLERGTFASPKQYRYLRDRVAQDDIASMWVRETEPPVDAELCILFEETFDQADSGARKWGRKVRRRERIIWCNSGGVIRVDTLKIGYDDKGGSSWVERVELGEVTPRAKCLEVARLDMEAFEDRRAKELEREAGLARQQRALIVAGRQQIVGRVLSVKWVESEFGGGNKMLVERGDGAKLYGTVPSAFSLKRDDMVDFWANVDEPREPGFAIFKRPAKMQVREKELEL